MKKILLIVSILIFSRLSAQDKKDLESKGFTDPVHLHDFPIRDHQVLLRVRRRKWRDKTTGETYTRDWDIKHEGTRYTKEFAAFLKKMFRHQTGKR